MEDIWQGDNGLYDMCLYASCDRLPEVSDLIQEVPVLADPTFQNRLMERSYTPGILGLELPAELAEQLFARFKAVGSEGYCFPAAYHHPRLTIEQAHTIAEQAIETMRVKYDPTDRVGPLFEYSMEGGYCWTFGATSERMAKEKLFPGALLASIDKLDGHIWTFEDNMRLWNKYN